ncbi:MAG: hypothetical protein VYB44_07075 [Bacteroidota bacterium]|nr:hypothetical protein [Bacteroidota bacterium]
MIRLNKDNDILIKFKPIHNCVGEKIIGEFFEIGVKKVGDANSIPVENVGAIEGALKTDIIEFLIDTTALEEEKTYSIVLRTAETGVIYVNQIYVNYGFH